MAYSQDSNLEMEPGQMKRKIIVRDFSGIAGKQAEAGVDRAIDELGLVIGERTSAKP